MSPAAVITLIILSAVLAWAPVGIRLIGHRQLSDKLKLALIAFTASFVLLIIFVFGPFELWDSHKFAAAGIPACLLAVFLAINDLKVSKPVAFGIIIGSLLNAFVWLFYSSLH